ncbi:MAG: hypothetical protein JSR21_00090 [Proteobacteria bacterium]|nr:hypothetical protein [Pseudomonadota bacterium]
MSIARVQDRIHWGLNVAARAVGAMTDAYRPSTADFPVSSVNRFLRLNAAFVPMDGRLSRPNAYGAALWQGLFDAAYTRVGDYLVQEAGTWFVAAQQSLLPVLCVQTNRTLSVIRPAVPDSAGINTYSGVTSGTNAPILTGWPASVLGVGAAGPPSAELPTDSSTPNWTVLLPAYADTVLLPNDMLQDDLGRNAVISAAELTDLGWRIVAKQATT